MLPSFSSKMLASYVDHICEESEWLTDALAKHAGKGPFQAENYISVYNFRNIIKTSGLSELSTELKSFKIFEDYYRCFELVYDRWTRLWVHPDIFYKLTNNYREMKKIVSSFTSYADRAQEIRRMHLANTDFMQKSRAYTDGQIKPGLFDSLIDKLNAKEVTEEMIVLVGATEEPSIAIGLILLLLGQYPSIQEKVYNEIRDIFEESDRLLSKEDIMKMQYLDLVIKETMRVYPPVPFIARKVDQDIELPSGRTIPAGAGLVIPVFTLHRHPAYWGPDAEHFDPERFLPERLAAVPDNAYIPFSYGPRGCPGYKFGFYMVKVAVCAILRKYKIVGKPAPGPVPDLSIKFEVSLRTVNRVEIEIVNRM